MIRVVRSAGEAAVSALTKTDRHGLSEREYAMWHFAGIAPTCAKLPDKPKRCDFKAYKASSVAEELEALFGPKCAYCESVYAQTAPMDIEHFRPKSGYLDDAGAIQKPGYYWLAADWNNLLPSCIDCNRERRHFRSSTTGEVIRSKSGKGNKFPIAKGSARATAPEDLAAEVPLLLDPCSDEPKAHLKFSCLGFVEAAPTPQEAAVPKGAASIKVFGLDRDRLRAERRSYALRVIQAMLGVLAIDGLQAEHPENPNIAVELARSEAELPSFLGRDLPYQAATLEALATFEAVRPAASAYRAAERTWRAAPTEANRAELRHRVDDVFAIVGRSDLDGELARQLFRAVGARVP